MTAAIVILAFLLVLSLLVWSTIRRRAATPSDFCYLNTKESEADLEVLTLLLSRSENEFLRTSLPTREFHRIKRQRLSLARKYLKAISQNTADFIRAAEAAKSSSDAEVAQAAHELLLIAFRVRLNVPLVHISLFAEWLFPALSLIAAPRLNAYKEMVAKIVFVLQRLASSQNAIESAS